MDKFIDAARSKRGSGPPETMIEFTRFFTTLVRMSVVGLFVIAFVFALYLGRYLFVPMVAGIVVGLMFAPLSGRLTRLGLKPFVSSALIVLSMVAVISLAMMSLAVPLDDWSARVPEVSRKLTNEWRKIRGPIDKLKKVEKQVDDASADKTGPMEVVVKPRGIVSSLISTAPDVIAWVLLFIGTLYFFLATRINLRASLLAFCPTMRGRLGVARIIRDVEQNLSRYVATTAAVNVVFGVIVGIAMYLVGLPSPHLWGALAMVLNFALFVGPAVMAVILLGVGMVTFPEGGQAFVPAIVFIALNLMEGQFVTPSVLGRSLTLNSLVVFLTIAFWLWLWGPVGAFLAVPVLVIFTVSFAHLIPDNPVPGNGNGKGQAKPENNPIVEGDA